MTKKLFLFLMIYAQAITISLSGTIIPISELASIKEYVTHDTLVIFDIDYTLVETHQELGGDRWLTHAASELDFERALSLYFAIQHKIELKLIEESTPDLIRELQKAGIPVLALTARSLPVRQRTHELLKKLDIHFDYKQPYPKTILFFLGDYGIYEHGIIFCANNCKGEMLRAFLLKTGLKPLRIVMVDDKEKYLHAINKNLEDLNIEFIGFHYTGMHEKLQNFDSAAADKQLEQFLQEHNIEYAW